jgi:hypothetical protein
MSASTGSAYQFAIAERQRAVEALRSAILACFQRPTGAQGTAFVSAQVDASGQLADPVVSPGGALATDVAVCLADRMSKVRLPAPTSAPSGLLLLITSTCAY